MLKINRIYKNEMKIRRELQRKIKLKTIDGKSEYKSTVLEF